jgi:hypothetical protein
VTAFLRNEVAVAKGKLASADVSNVLRGGVYAEGKRRPRTARRMRRSRCRRGSLPLQQQRTERVAGAERRHHAVAISRQVLVAETPRPTGATWMLAPSHEAHPACRRAALPARWTSSHLDLAGTPIRTSRTPVLLTAAPRGTCSRQRVAQARLRLRGLPAGEVHRRAFLAYIDIDEGCRFNRLESPMTYLVEKLTDLVKMYIAQECTCVV